MAEDEPKRERQVTIAVERLRHASATREPCAPVRELIGGLDAQFAYEIQRRIVGERIASGRTIVGRKVGLTSAAVQAQLGVDQPDFGFLLDDMWQNAKEPISLGALIQPKVEAEVAFILASDVVDPGVTAATVGHHVDHAVAALEIVDSRIQNWDITFCDTVADNASSGLFALGSMSRRLEDLRPRDIEMTMLVNDVPASAGSGAACMDDPLNALAWLARTAIDNGSPLRAGDVVLSGALGPMVPVFPGDVVAANFTELGELLVSFTS